MTLSELAKQRQDITEVAGGITVAKHTLEVIKALDDLPHGGFEGYASVFNMPDELGDVILKGAFSDVLTAFKRDGFITVGHQVSGTVGVATISDAFEDERGLYIKAHFHSDAEAQQLRQRVTERLERGATVSLSIHGLVEWEDVEFRDDGGMTIRRFARLIETSLTLIPAQRMALVTSAKEGAATETTTEAEGVQPAPADGPEQGLRFADESEAVLAAVKGFVERAGELADLRARSGRRHLSEQNVVRLREHLAAFEEAADELRVLIAPPPEDAAPEDVLKEPPETDDAARDRLLALHRHRAQAAALAAVA